LDLNRESNLKTYVNYKRFCLHSVLNWNNVQQTNLVKCQTKVEMPEDIQINGRRTFMNRAFTYCSKHIEEEIFLFNPKLIISLSGRVADLLQRQFLPEMKRLYIRDIFGTKQKLKVKGSDYVWIPAVHITQVGRESMTITFQNRLLDYRDYMTKFRNYSNKTLLPILTHWTFTFEFLPLSQHPQSINQPTRIFVQQLKAICIWSISAIKCHRNNQTYPSYCSLLLLHRCYLLSCHLIGYWLSPP